MKWIHLGLEDREEALAVGALLEVALGDGAPLEVALEDGPHYLLLDLAFWVAQALALVTGGLDLEVSWGPGKLCTLHCPKLSRSFNLALQLQTKFLIHLLRNSHYHI